MARSYGRVFAAIWDDPDFVARSPTAQRMYLFLLSQPDLEHSGIIPLRERRWAKGCGALNPSMVADDLKELEAHRFLVIDDDTEELLVRSLIRRDEVWKQPNVFKSALSSAIAAKSPRIREALAAELRRLDLNEELAAARDIAVRRLEPFANPSLTPSEPSGSHPGTTPEASADGQVAESAGNDETAGQNPSGTLSEGNPCSYGERGEGNGGSVEASPYPFPLSPQPQPEGQPKRKRGTRIPADFKVTPEMVTWAREKCPHVDGKRETEKFINYWQAKSGKDATKLDWAATWKNWMLNAAERAPHGRASPGRPQSQTPIRDQWMQDRA